MADVHIRMQVPLALLVISATLQLLFVLGSLAWMGLNLLSTAVRVGMYADDPTLLGLVAATTIWSGLTKLPQALLSISGAITARGAYHAATEGRAGVIRLGALAALIGPLVALFGSFCLWLSFDCIGFLVGGVGRMLMVVLGVLAIATTTTALQDPEVAALYPEPEPYDFD